RNRPVPAIIELVRTGTEQHHVVIPDDLTLVRDRSIPHAPRQHRLIGEQTPHRIELAHRPALRNASPTALSRPFSKSASLSETTFGRAFCGAAATPPGASSRMPSAPCPRPRFGPI